ncbi:MAG: 2-oxoacid:acceptor oxidoreductase family protein [Halobacteriota archaeon]
MHGGHNTFQLRIDAQRVRGPVQTVDVLAALSDETTSLYLNDIMSGGTLPCDAKSFNDVTMQRDSRLFMLTNLASRLTV